MTCAQALRIALRWLQQYESAIQPSDQEAYQTFVTKANETIKRTA